MHTFHAHHYKTIREYAAKRKRTTTNLGLKYDLSEAYDPTTIELASLKRALLSAFPEPGDRNWERYGT
jgi:hypothetical protein